MRLASAAGRKRLDRRFDQAVERQRLQVDAQLAGDDAGHVEHVFDQLRLRPGVPVDHFEAALRPRRVDLPVPQHRGPAEDGVERRAQLVRQGGEELVLQPARRLGLLPGLLEGREQVADLELPRRERAAPPGRC